MPPAGLRKQPSARLIAAPAPIVVSEFADHPCLAGKSVEQRLSELYDIVDVNQDGDVSVSELLASFRYPPWSSFVGGLLG